MLRRKNRRNFRIGNLKKGEEKIALHFEQINSGEERSSGSSRITERQDIRKGGSVAAKDATVTIDSTKAKDEATNVKVKGKPNRILITENNLSVFTPVLERPGTSGARTTGKSSSKRDKTKNTQDRAVQMRQNLSAQRLQGNDDLDDDISSTEEPARRPRYILVGWDSFRSKTMVLLLILLLLWAAIYFPLI